jgi:serine/threonine protein kinase
MRRKTVMNGNIYWPTDGIPLAEYTELRREGLKRERRRLPIQLLKSLPAFILPLVYIVAPLKVTLLITICSVVGYVCVQLVLPKFCPTLYTLMRRSFLHLESRSPAAKCAADFVTNIKPFVLWGLFLNPPIALLMMAGNALRRCLALGTKSSGKSALETDSNLVRIRQNSRALSEVDSNFVSTSAFTVTAAALFLSGIPAALAFYMYNLLGVDRLLGYPSISPEFFKVFFGILLYAYSVGWCLSTLFFKAYFTYPLSNTSFERHLELDEHAVRLTHIEGWFSQVLWFTTPACWARELKWSEIRSVEFHSAGVGPLSPLPDKCLSKGSVIYRFLNKFAALTDAIAARQKPASYITIYEYPTWQARLSRSIRINLWELNERERLTLYITLRKYAPHAVISEEAQKQLTGTAVSDEVFSRTEWCEQLTSSTELLSRTRLQPADTLSAGSLRVCTVLESDGVANLYEASNSLAETVLLKEYILSGSADFSREFSLASQIEQEVRLHRQIDDPRVPKLLQSFVENRRVYLVCENPLGRSLRQVVNENGSLSEEQVQNLALQLTSLLRLLHTMPAPIVHGAVSPDSLYLACDNKLLLSDFSLAQYANAHASVVRYGRPAYTPPEQFRGELDLRSDIYAAGATLYFLLTGKDPCPLVTSSPRSDGAAISSRLDGVIRHATALEVDDRYESAQWMELDLQAPASIQTAVV